MNTNYLNIKCNCGEENRVFFDVTNILQTNESLKEIGSDRCTKCGGELVIFVSIQIR